MGFNSRKILHLIILIFLQLLILPSCKKTDNEPPNLIIEIPVTQLYSNAASFQQIKGIASDNDALGNLSISLVNENTGKIESVLSFPLEGTSDSFYELFEMGSRYSQTGNNLLKIVLFDKAGNSSQEEFQVYLIEMPLQFSSAWFASTTGPSSSVISKWDSAGILSQGPVLDFIPLKIEFDSKENRLIVGDSSGVIHLFDPGSFVQQLLIQDGTIGLPHPLNDFSIFRDLYNAVSSIYTARDEAPFIKGYNGSGFSFTNFGTNHVPNPVISITYDEDQVFGIQKNPAPGSQAVLFSCDRSPAELQFVAPALNYDPANVFPFGGEKIIVVGSESETSGPIEIYSRNDLAILHSLTAGERIKQSCWGYESCWFLTESGARELSHNLPQTLKPVVVAGTFSSIGFEDAGNRVFLGSTGSVEVYTTTGSLINSINGISGEVNRICFGYNK